MELLDIAFIIMIALIGLHGFINYRIQDKEFKNSVIVVNLFVIGGMIAGYMLLNFMFLNIN